MTRRAVLTEAAVLAIRASRETTKALAARYEVTQETLQLARDSLTWRHLPPAAHAVCDGSRRLRSDGPVLCGTCRENLSAPHVMGAHLPGCAEVRRMVTCHVVI
jgi:hypothetical protein